MQCRVERKRDFDIVLFKLTWWVRQGGNWSGLMVMVVVGGGGGEQLGQLTILEPSSWAPFRLYRVCTYRRRVQDP